MTETESSAMDTQDAQEAKNASTDATVNESSEADDLIWVCSNATKYIVKNLNPKQIVAILRNFEFVA